MRINDLYDLADQRGYEVIYTSLPQTKSLAMYDDGKCTIGMDTGLHGIDELEHAAHEIGHCETSSFYCFTSDEISRLRCEYKANKWAYNHLVPFDELITAFQSGCTNVWDLADRFNVHPDTMQKILFYYFEK